MPLVFCLTSRFPGDSDIFGDGTPSPKLVHFGDGAASSPIPHRHDARGRATRGRQGIEAEELTMIYSEGGTGGNGVKAGNFLPETPANGLSLRGEREEGAQRESEEEEKLPAGWKSRLSRKWKKRFYYDAVSGKTQWNRPLFETTQVPPEVAEKQGLEKNSEAGNNDSSLSMSKSCATPSVRSNLKWSCDGVRKRVHVKECCGSLALK